MHRFLSPIVVVVALSACSSVPSSEEPVRDASLRNLSSADSAAVWISALRGTIAHALPDFDVSRGQIWTPSAAMGETPRPNDGSILPFSPQVLRTLQATLPNLEFVENLFENPSAIFDELFECPEGARVLMPTYGCPLKDEGIVVFVGLLREGGRGEVQTKISVVTSDDLGEDRPPARRWLTSQSIFTVRMSRAPSGKWNVVEVTLYAIT